MNPQDIPQILRDIADTLEQMIGGGQGGQGAAGGQAPADIAGMMPAGGEGQQG